MYEHEVDQQAVNYTLAERNIYGSARLGSNNHKVDIYTADLENPVNSVLGEKFYEVSNHLGNVLAVFNDVKYPISSGTTVDYFEVALVSVSDYSPFGVQLDGRTFEGAGYRYGYQGSEKDDEIKGEGNSYTTHFRQLDPRVGRWLSIDPKANAQESPYASMGNNPIFYTDSKGDTIKWANNLEMGIMQTRINKMRKNSNSFNTLMASLEASESVFSVQLNEKMSENGLFSLNLTTGNGTVSLKMGNTDETVLEEFFHAFQSTVYDYQSEDSPDANPMSRTVSQAESEANLYQVFALGELNESLNSTRGAIYSLAEKSFFNSLRDNMFLITSGTEVEGKYYNYLEEEEIMNQGWGDTYGGKQEELLPSAYNKIISNSIVTDVQPPESGVTITAPKK